ISASETPKSRLETRSFPPVSTPAPPPPPAAPLKPLKPLSNMSCCHLSGSCLGCNRRKRTHLPPGRCTGTWDKNYSPKSSKKSFAGELSRCSGFLSPSI
uniref:Uncharacterized protein n=1 Tax=Amphiprion ocellaris TaxID=80972 RepID=A0AAQ5YE33_AMPOC